MAIKLFKLLVVASFTLPFVAAQSAALANTGLIHYEGSTTSATHSFEVVSGEKAVLWINQTCIGTTYTINSSPALTWTQRIAPFNNGDGTESVMYDAPIAATGSLSVTWSLGASCFATTYLHRVYGGTFDAGSFNHTAVDPAVSNAVTPTGTDVLIGIYSNIAGSWTPGSGFTININADNQTSMLESKASITTGSTTSASGNAGAGTNIGAVAYKSVTTSALSTITLSPANPTLQVAIPAFEAATSVYVDTTTLNAAGVASWSSSNTAVATVDTNGNISCLSSGTSTITATLGGHSGNTTLSCQYTGHADDVYGGHGASHGGINCTWPPITKVAITSITRTGGVVTASVANTTNFDTVRGVYITGVTDTSFNITIGIAPIPSAVVSNTSITYAQAGSNATSSGGFIVPAAFSFAKVNNRWWYCTPLGNGFFSIPVSAAIALPNSATDTRTGLAQIGSTILDAKYGDHTTNWGSQQNRRVSSWGFNTVGQDSDQAMYNNAAVPMPYRFSLQFGLYVQANLSSRATQAVKDILRAHSSNFHGPAHGSSFIDVFDPDYTQWLNSNGSTVDSDLSNTRHVGSLIDDIDFFASLGGGPDFDSTPAGNNYDNAGYLVVTTSPVQGFSNTNAYNGIAQIYPDPRVFSKVAAASAPVTCAIATPCSLRDYLQKRYSTVGALNTAWSTSYTTLDSTGTCVGYNFGTSICASGAGSASQSIGTGNGATTLFNFTLHANLDPFSVQISQGGTLIGGDCPANAGGYHTNCGGSSGTGSMVGTGIASGSCTYTTGVCSITFTVAPANGQALTANFIWGGWGGGGTGLMDEDGNTASIGTNGVCLEGGGGGVVPGQRGYACRSGNPAGWGAVSANATTGSDLDAWTTNLGGQYFSAISNGVKAHNPLFLYLGPDTFGAYFNPPSRELLQAAVNYLDGAYLGIDPTVQAQIDYVAQYLGDKPFLHPWIFEATPDSALYKYVGNTFRPLYQYGTQAAKGAFWSSQMTTLLTSKVTSTGTFPYVSIDLWGLYDFGNFEKVNWGIVSLSDNPYDGSRACLSPAPETIGIVTYTSGNGQVAEPSMLPGWQAATTYEAGDQGNTAPDSGQAASCCLKGARIQVNLSGTIYELDSNTFTPAACTTGGSQPVFNTAIGATTVDNTCTWTTVAVRPSSTCFGDALTAITAANSLWFANAAASTGGGVSNSKTVTSSKVVK